jgi:membrane associated rhomboid family serine protease
MPDDVGPVPPPSADPAARPCYRHPDRMTYVSCTRCGRPICAEDMRPAPVGFQCPDDVAAASRELPRQVNPLGGPARRRPPFVTYTLVALNVIAFVLEGLPFGGLPYQPNDFVQRYVGLSHTYAGAPDIVLRLLSAAFLHTSIFHIGLNMLALVLLGQQLEQVLGWLRYLVLYLVSAIGGGALFFFLGTGSSLGASGAIFGLFSAFYLVARRLRVDSSSILTTIGINLVLTFLIPGISIWDHIGGLITGAVVGVVYTRLPSRPATAQALQVGIVVALGVVLAVIVGVRSAAGA